MDKWAKIELMRNLNKIGEPDVIEDDGHGFHMTIHFYDIKTAIKDTFKFRNKSNLFKAGHNFFCEYTNINYGNEENLFFMHGYKNNFGDVIETNYIKINHICKLKRVSK